MCFLCCCFLGGGGSGGGGGLFVFVCFFLLSFLCFVLSDEFLKEITKQ